MSSGYDTSGTFNTYVGGGGARFFQYTSATNSGALLATAPATGSLAVNGGLVVVGGVSAAGLTLSGGSGGVAATGPCSIAGANTLEFGYGVAGKDGAAGKIGYGTFSGGASLDIVGAGISGSNRQIRLFAEGGTILSGAATILGKATAGAMQVGADINAVGADLSLMSGKIVMYTYMSTGLPTWSTNNGGERILLHGGDRNYGIGIGTDLTTWNRAWAGHRFYAGASGALVQTMTLDALGTATIAGPLVTTCGGSGNLSPPIVNPTSSAGTINAGQRLVLFKQADGLVDNAIGQMTGSMWISCVSTDTIRQYVGTTVITETSAGGLAVNGNITVAGDFKGMELGAGVVGKDVNAGRIYYDPGQPNGVLSIVGWGTSNTNRKVMLWAEGGTMLTGGLTANGPVVATQLAATGTIAVGPPAANPTGGIGARVIVWADAGARPTEYPYAIGSDSGQMWYLVPPGGAIHRFYSGSTVVADLGPTGVAINTPLTVAGGITSPNMIMTNDSVSDPTSGSNGLGERLRLTSGEPTYAIGIATDLSLWYRGFRGHKFYASGSGSLIKVMSVDAWGNTTIAGSLTTGGTTVNGSLTVSSGGVTTPNAVTADRFALTPNRYGGTGDVASVEVLTRGGEDTYLLIQNNNDPQDSIALVATGGVSVNTTVAPGPNQMLVGGGLQVTGAMSIAGANTLEFGQGVAGKDSVAGRIGYGTYSSGSSLDIVGAGTTGNRKITMFAEGGVTIQGAVTASGAAGSMSPPIANPASSAGTTNLGQRVLLWKSNDAVVDFALGIDAGAMWQSVPGTAVHRQYVGTTKITETSGTGFAVAGGLTVNGPIVNNMYPIPQLSFTLPGGSPSYNDIGVGAALNLAGLEPGNTTTFGNLLGRAFLGLTSLPTDMPPITMMRIVFRGVALENGGCNVVIEAVQGYYGYPGSWNSIQSAMNPAITSQCQVVSEGSNRGLVTAVTPWFTPTNSPGWSSWDVPQIGLRVVSTGVAAAGTLFRFSEITLQFA